MISARFFRVFLLGEQPLRAQSVEIGSFVPVTPQH
jgi:hypothetical protein